MLDSLGNGMVTIDVVKPLSHFRIGHVSIADHVKAFAWRPNIGPGCDHGVHKGWDIIFSHENSYMVGGGLRPLPSAGVSESRVYAVAPRSN